MDWLWVVGYFVVGIIISALFRAGSGGWDGDISESMMLGAIVLFWPMSVPVLIIVGIGKLANLLGDLFQGGR